MNNNIKEILELYKDDDIEYYNQASDLGYDKFLDCIINLQESEAYYYGQYKDYKSRNEKAIEYIKTTSFFNKSHYDFKQDLLNILDGGDDNE